MNVRGISKEDRPAWNEFVESHPDATFFHYAEWQDVFEGNLGHECVFLVCEDAGAIQGVLPLTYVSSRLFGRALVSMPFLVYGGVAANSGEAEQTLIQTACEIASARKVDHLELRHMRAVCSDWFTKSSHVTFRKTLSESADENLLAIPRKQRAMVRKGIKAGLRAEIDDHVGRLYPILLECKRNLGTPFFSKSYLQSIVDAFGSKAEITTVLKDNDVVAGVMSFRFRDEILPFYGGGGMAARDLYANDFMYWAVMQKACEDGIKIFDYGRSQIGSGPYRFKKHWGFEPQPLYYECKSLNGSEISTPSPNDSRYARAINIWKKLPLPVAGVIGPHLARVLY